jgi:hypothetical protein
MHKEGRKGGRESGKKNTAQQKARKISIESGSY